MAQLATRSRPFPRALLIPFASQIVAALIGVGGAAWLLIQHITKPVLSSFTAFSISALLLWIGLTMLRVVIQTIRYHGAAPPSRAERIHSRAEMYVALLLAFLTIVSLQLSFHRQAPPSLRQRFIDYEKTHSHR
jgi:hypothetical protein